jgi:signal transduction histidine kinase
VFLYNKDASAKIKTIFLLLLLPVLLFAYTDLGISGFNISDCDAFGYEGFWFNAYYTALGALAMVWILPLLISGYRKAEKNMKKQIILMGTGIELFLFSFFSITFLSGYLANEGYLPDSSFEFYALFGMVIFMTIMGVLIVKFKSFNVGATSSVALTIGLVILTASQFTYVESRSGSMITSITLILTGLIGMILIRSVKKEIKQKAELVVLTNKLSSANNRLKDLDKLKSEFVSIASHQLRSPLTAIRGYASMVLEGSYGKVPEKAREAIARIEDSSKLMALGIEDYLNVSRIEAGNMKYTVSDFNLKNETEKICDDLRIDAIKKGLILIFRTDLKSKGIVSADIGKTVQIIQNLIHNSIKYTEKGSIRILVRDDVVNKKIHIDIEDTGIGMSPETLNKIFQKFERADNANSVNVSGTGLGLYVAVKMTEAMNGEIKAYSDGDSKGSRFTITLPLAM